MLEKKPSRF